MGVGTFAVRLRPTLNSGALFEGPLSIHGRVDEGRQRFRCPPSLSSGALSESEQIESEVGGAPSSPQQRCADWGLLPSIYGA